MTPFLLWKSDLDVQQIRPCLERQVKGKNLGHLVFDSGVQKGER